MDVGSLSIDMSIAKTMQSVGIAMAKNVMTTAEQQGAAIIQMAEAAVPTTPPTDTIAINMRV